MKNLYIIYTHNRPAVLQQSIQTLLNSNVQNPDKIIIIDDASDHKIRDGLYNFTKQYAGVTSVDFYSFANNAGYGMAAELGFTLAELYNPQYVYFIESDYIFSKNGIDIVNDIFENTLYGQYAAGFSGYDNPDFYSKQKTEQDFPNILKSDYGYDNLNREILYKPFDVETKFGTKQLELVSNSCGTMYFNWKVINEIKKDFPNEYREWVNRVVNKNGYGKRNLNDGVMSHGISWLWQKWAEKHNIDRNKYAALLNVKPSIANHINGGGINGSNITEGQSVTLSPSWKE